ncbi:MAG: hypothetical protein Q8867_07980 [Bacteroidota bacterium]|nr:hypothetical protein [Bacteroidota bacterium]
MRNLLVASKVFNLLIILCFFLPFLPEGCSTSHKDIKAMAIADSIRIVDSLTLIHETVPDSVKKVMIRDQRLKSLQVPATMTEKFISDCKILQPVLRPRDGYSGIGLMIDGFSVSWFYISLLLSFVLSISCFILILRRKPALYLLLFILTILGLAAFVTFKMTYINLAGHWRIGATLEIILWVCLTLINLGLIRERRKADENSTETDS